MTAWWRWRGPAVGVPLALALALAVCSGAARAHGPEAASLQQPAPAAAAALRPPELVARFQVRFTPRGGHTRVQTWQLARGHDQISWIKGRGDEDLWHREPGGLRLERVLRADRTVIDYAAGELRALGVTPDWEALGSLFAEADLALLRPTGPPRPGQARHYRGRLGAEQVDLVWDPVARLPLRLLRSGAAGRVLYQRTALHAALPPDWPRAGAGSDDWPRLDAADFGDLEDDPVVRRALARDAAAGWRAAPH